MSNETDQRELEESLRAAAPAPPAEWERLRGRLAGEAERDGLVDVAYERHETPLGAILVGATREGLVRVGLPSEDEGGVLAELARRISPRVLRSSRASLTQARRELDEYFGHGRREFATPLDWRLVAGFRRDVLRATARIPYGRTASYREIAAGAGSPNAVRAAGTALATNPLPIVIPCHRVLRTGGGLGQYRGGPDAKAWLLQLEGAA
jgi:methylated-DNA-[protein]-cysteine S-methyltransferase